MDGPGGHDSGNDHALNDDGSTSDAGRESGRDTSTSVVLSGAIRNFSTMAAISGVMVSGAGQTTTSDAAGLFALSVTQDIPLMISLTAPTYARVFSQALSLSSSFDIGALVMITTATNLALQKALTGYDPSRGAIVVQALLTPGGLCTSEGGAIISTTPAGIVTYFSGGAPNATIMSVVANETPSAIVYNLPPGIPITLTVTHPRCSQLPYPVTLGAITFTGEMQVEAGDALTASRVFLR